MSDSLRDSCNTSPGSDPAAPTIDSGAYEILELKTDHDAEQLVDLFRVVFGDADASVWQSFHGNAPLYARRWSRVIKYDGKMVCHVCWVPREMRVGCAVLRVGMIGYVVTHPDFRRRGLVAKLMHGWADELTAKGYHLSIIMGIPEFYEQFGYSFAFPNDSRDTAVVLNLEDCRPLPQVPNHSCFEMADMSVLEHLYQTGNACRTGAFVRSHEYWTGLIEGLRQSNKLSHQDIWLVKDAQEQAVGYAFLRHRPQGQYEILEASAPSDAAADGLLALAASNARSTGAKSVELRLPLDHRVTRRALHHGACLSGYSFGNYARIFNLEELFVALRPELERRLRASEWKSWRGTLQMRTDIGDVDIGIADGSIHMGDRSGETLTVDIPQRLLVRLVTGYANVAGVSGLGRADIDPLVGSLLAVLFPKGCPYLWTVDVGY